ncbi:hypothetical protein CYCME_2298 [Cycloclasticus zancles 78-ME]|uniref:Uncharacterized protein n=1 Tax=Cycloclasticus zancles 78-ME TaxID=1198232 RepID=S5TZF9_9GAMM|nr:hypothetical protein CYCME_2298 [Cycloclasticus zancles 78-ME]
MRHENTLTIMNLSNDNVNDNHSHYLLSISLTTKCLNLNELIYSSLVAI